MRFKPPLARHAFQILHITGSTLSYKNARQLNTIIATGEAYQKLSLLQFQSLETVMGNHKKKQFCAIIISSLFVFNNHVPRQSMSLSFRKKESCLIKYQN